MSAQTLGDIISAPARMRWSRERYYSAVDAGVIGEDDKVELIGGELVTEGMADRMAQKSLHARAVIGVAEALERAFGSAYHARQQLPVSLGLDSGPEPDDAVVAGSRHDYKNAHPTTAVLIVEVSDTTLRFDQQYKASLYASAGIAGYWIVNLVERRLEVRRRPVLDDAQQFGLRYADLTVLSAEESVSTLAAPDASISVGGLLP